MMTIINVFVFTILLTLPTQATTVASLIETSLKDFIDNHKKVYCADHGEICRETIENYYSPLFEYSKFKFEYDSLDIICAASIRPSYRLDYKIVKERNSDAVSYYFSSKTGMRNHRGDCLKSIANAIKRKSRNIEHYDRALFQIHCRKRLESDVFDYHLNDATLYFCIRAEYALNRIKINNVKIDKIEKNILLTKNRLNETRYIYKQSISGKIDAIVAFLDDTFSSPNIEQKKPESTAKRPTELMQPKLTTKIIPPSHPVALMLVNDFIPALSTTRTFPYEPVVNKITSLWWKAGEEITKHSEAVDTKYKQTLAVLNGISTSASNISKSIEKATDKLEELKISEAKARAMRIKADKDNLAKRIKAEQEAAERTIKAQKELAILRIKSEKKAAAERAKALSDMQKSQLEQFNKMRDDISKATEKHATKATDGLKDTVSSGIKEGVSSVVKSATDWWNSLW